MPRIGFCPRGGRALGAASFEHAAAPIFAPQTHRSRGSIFSTWITSVRPQDDLYRHLNGKWLDSFQIPADKGSYGSFTYLYDLTQEQLRGIVEGSPHGSRRRRGAKNRRFVRQLHG